MSILELKTPEAPMLEFSKQQRLLRRLEFTKTMDEGIKIVTPHMVLIARPTGADLTRIGFIVSKKVGGAVERNRVKRRLREHFRICLDKPQGFDLVIIARGHALTSTFDALGLSMLEAFTNLRNRLEREARERAAPRAVITPRVINRRPEPSLGL